MAPRHTGGWLQLIVALHRLQRVAGQGPARNHLVGHCGRSSGFFCGSGLFLGTGCPSGLFCGGRVFLGSRPATPAASSGSSSAEALQDAMNVAIEACEDAGRPSLDIARGDINMARRNTGNSELWHDATYDFHETCGVSQMYDWRGECCFGRLRDVAPTASSTSAERSANAGLSVSDF